MKIIFIGDIVGKDGRDAVIKIIPDQKFITDNEVRNEF